MKSIYDCNQPDFVCPSCRTKIDAPLPLQVPTFEATVECANCKKSATLTARLREKYINITVDGKPCEKLRKGVMWISYNEDGVVVKGFTHPAEGTYYNNKTQADKFVWFDEYDL